MRAPIFSMRSVFSWFSDRCEAEIDMVVAVRRRPRSLGGGALLGALSVFLIAASGAGPKEKYADAFVDLVKEHRFDDAAKMFFYPPSYSPQRLAREETKIGAFLESLFKVAGDLSDQTRGAPRGANAWWSLGVSGADGPVDAADIGADSSGVLYYEGHFTNEGTAMVALILVHIRGKWQILRFDFNIPRSASHGPADFAEFSRRVFSGCRACEPGKDT
jgi:hypothetical protein